MNNKFNASISLEKFSAFLDGNLSDSEMLAVSKEIAKDEFLNSMVDANAETDEIIASDSNGEGVNDLIDEDSFELPSLDFPHDSVGNFDLGDIWLENDSSLPINDDGFEDSPYMVAAMNESFKESSYVERNLESSHHIMKDKVNYGYEPNYEDSTFDLNIYQGNQPSCAIRSQEIIMRDYGVSIPQEELIEFAIKNGWYDSDPENGGTPRDATGNLLDAVGIETKRYDDASIFDIISELRAGHRVIVSVDANELWIKKEPKLYKRIFGELTNRLNDKIDDFTGIQGANHALIVAGVNVNPANPSDMRVVLIDSGSGDVCIEYSFKDFKKAWDDSHCHMVTTTEPAPYQYNYHTHQMEPSNFSTDFIPSMVSLPAGMQNDFHLPENYYVSHEDYTPHYDGLNDSESAHEFFSEVFGPNYSTELNAASTNVHNDSAGEEERVSDSDLLTDDSSENGDGTDEDINIFDSNPDSLTDDADDDNDVCHSSGISDDEHSLDTDDASDF